MVVRIHCKFLGKGVALNAVLVQYWRWKATVLSRSEALFGGLNGNR